MILRIKPILLAAAMLFPQFVEAAESLIENGKGRAEIVIAEQPTRTVKLAAQELQTYLEKISGAKLPISTTPTKTIPLQIYVGQSQFTDKLEIRDGLKHGAFRIVSGKNWLALIGQDKDFVKPKFYLESPTDLPQFMKTWDAATGEQWGFANGNLYKEYNNELKIWARDERGSLNAVYEFLRRLGVRWYLPDELGEVVPQQKTITLPAVDDTVHPDFALRFPYQYARMFGHAGTTRDELLWQLRLGWNQAADVIGDFGMSLSHGMNPIYERPEVREAHPEWYFLSQGKRDELKVGQSRPCLSATGIFSQNVKYVRTMFDLLDVPMVSVMPQDGFASLCQCELCKGKETLERGWEGQISDYVWSHANRVAAEIYKTHPDRKLSCYAYGAYLLPPTKIDTLSPNLVVGICQTRIDLADPQIRQQFEKLRRDWLAKLPEGNRQFLINDYYLSGRSFTAPNLPNYYPRTIARDLNSLKGISLGDFIEVHRDVKGMESLAVDHLNLYVTSRYWWDADQDIDALLAEYYRDFYGPAAKEMQAYVEFSEENLIDLRKNAEKMTKALILLEAAQKKVDAESVHGKRLAWIAGYFQPMYALRDQAAKGRENVPEAAAFLRDGKDLTLDGKLDDPFWKSLWVYELQDLETGKRPYMATSFRIGWVDSDIVFGIRCEDRNTKELTIGATKNEDSNIWTGDCVEVLLETQTHSYYQLAVNPTGAIMDLDREKGLNSSWESSARVACHIGEGFWSAEVRIPVVGEQQAVLNPLYGVAGRQPSETYPWYFNVCRQRIRPDDAEYSAFSPTGAASFHVGKKFAKLKVR